MQFFKLLVYAIHLGLQEQTPYTYKTFSLWYLLQFGT